MAGPPLDAHQRGVGHQRSARRKRLPAEVRGLQPGDRRQKDPLRADVRGVHRPQVPQVCPAATVGDLGVGPCFYSPLTRRHLALKVFEVFICTFFRFFIDIIYESIYTLTFKFIDLFDFRTPPFLCPHNHVLRLRRRSKLKLVSAHWDYQGTAAPSGTVLASSTAGTFEWNPLRRPLHCDSLCPKGVWETALVSNGCADVVRLCFFHLCRFYGTKK